MVELDNVHWECALVGNKLYVTRDTRLPSKDRVYTVYDKQFVEDVYRGYPGYKVTKLKQFKGNV